MSAALTLYTAASVLMPCPGYNRMSAMANTIDPTKGTLPQKTTPEQTAAGMTAALSDRSQYIRTMAKDMAALSGTQAAPAPARREEKKKNEETFSGVTTEKHEEPFFERTRPAYEDRPKESVALPTMEDASSIVSSESATPTPPAPVTPMAAIKPIAPTANVEASRTAILERLRRKVEDSAQISIERTPEPLKSEVPYASVPEEPKEKQWPDIPTPPPSFAPIAPKQETATPAPIVAAPAAPKIVEPVPVPPPVVSAPEPIPAQPMAPKPEPLAPQAAPEAAWRDIPSPAPAFAPLSEPQQPAIATPRETYREPIDEYVPARPIQPPAGPTPFHTYTSDFANRIDSQGSSAFSVLAAEQDSGTPAAPVSKRRVAPSRAVVMVATGIVLLVLAGGGAFAAYQFVMTMRNTPIASITVPSIVFADEYRELEGSGNALLGSLAAASNGALVPGNVLVTYILASADGEGDGLITAPAGGDVFMRALQLPMPDILLRNIAKESTIGIINAGGMTAPFFALRVDSYERTYAGMLTWEPLLARDLALLYPLYPVMEAPVLDPTPTVSTSTASSTLAASSTAPVITSAPAQATARTRFEDAIVSNHDVRVLRDTDGRSLILYGYADKRTLLIVRDEASFEALLARLKAE